MESKYEAVGFLFLLPVIGLKESQVNSTTLISTAVKLGGDDDAESREIYGYRLKKNNLTARKLFYQGNTRKPRYAMNTHNSVWTTLFFLFG